MTDADRAAILAEIVAATAPPLRERGDFTAAEYATEYLSQTGNAMTVQTATRLLNEQVRQGRLKSCKRFDSDAGRWARVWWQ